MLKSSKLKKRDDFDTVHNKFVVLVLLTFLRPEILEDSISKANESVHN